MYTKSLGRQIHNTMSGLKKWKEPIPYFVMSRMSQLLSLLTFAQNAYFYP